MPSILKQAAMAATVLLAAQVNCHMVMKTPVPYGKSTLNNSPLDASGSDFPCKQRPGVYDAEGAQNIMAIGEPQTLSFTGSAVHGGGSCQVALTTDLQPTKDSKWMVIKSIEGGCPASVAGNLPADPNGNGASTFQFTIPDGIAPGDYTLAWTWFNKVGNREMYMNCAPAQVTSAKKRRWQPAPKVSKKRQTSFPNLFVANLASINTCTTPEGQDYIFPNPGDEVQTVGQGPFTQLACGAGGNTSPQQPTGALASGSAPAATGTAPTATSVRSGNAPGATGAPSGPGGANPTFAYGTGTQAPGNGGAAAPTKPGVFVTDAASATSDVLSVIPVATATAAPASPDRSGNSSGSTTTNSSGSCTVGDWSCSTDGSSFQRCVSGGTWSVSMNMAAGMVCTPGVSANLDMKVKSTKRSHKHRRHLFGESH